VRGNACPGYSVGSGISLKQRAYASELDWEWRLRLTFDKSPVRERPTPGPVRGRGATRVSTATISGRSGSRDASRSQK
jgi:hypothetical protein